MENTYQLMEKLSAWGAEPKEALSRMLDDAEFYHHLLDEFVKGNGFGRLASALEAGLYQDAFRIAHEQKGASATLSLTPLFQAFSDATEDLRQTARSTELSVRPGPDLPEHMRTLHGLWDEFQVILTGVQ